MEESEPEPEPEPESGAELGKIDDKTAIAFTHGNRMLGIIESLGLPTKYKKKYTNIKGQKKDTEVKVNFQNGSVVKLVLSKWMKKIKPISCEVFYCGPYGELPQIPKQLPCSQVGSSGNKPTTATALEYNEILYDTIEAMNESTTSSAAELEPEPDTTVSAASAIRGVNRYEDALREIYTIHRPEKVKDIPQLLIEWRGKEEELLKKVNEAATTSGPYVVYLVRHGHASHSEEDRYTKLWRWKNPIPINAYNTHLTDRGMIEAYKCGKYLRDVNFNLLTIKNIFISDLIRTSETLLMVYAGFYNILLDTDNPNLTLLKLLLLYQEKSDIPFMNRVLVIPCLHENPARSEYKNPGLSSVKTPMNDENSSDLTEFTGIWDDAENNVGLPTLAEKIFEGITERNTCRDIASEHKWNSLVSNDTTSENYIPEIGEPLLQNLTPPHPVLAEMNQELAPWILSVARGDISFNRSDGERPSKGRTTPSGWSPDISLFEIVKHLRPNWVLYKRFYNFYRGRHDRHTENASECTNSEFGPLEIICDQINTARFSTEFHTHHLLHRPLEGAPREPYLLPVEVNKATGGSKRRKTTKRTKRRYNHKKK